MSTGPLNPVTAGYLDSSGNATSVDPTHPLPVTPAAEAAASAPILDPNTTAAATEIGLLRGLLSDLADMNNKQQDRLDTIINRLEALNAMIAIAFDIADGPDAYY